MGGHHGLRARGPSEVPNLLGRAQVEGGALSYPRSGGGGDFNLIRSPDDKSSGNVDVPRMQMFNDCIADLALREITRVGARYTWSNNRIEPTRSVLDRVLVSVEWEIAFPL